MATEKEKMKERLALYEQDLQQIQESGDETLRDHMVYLLEKISEINKIIASYGDS
jgi:hypothetical protein